MGHSLRLLALSLAALLFLSLPPQTLAVPLSISYDPKTEGWTLSAQEVPFESLLSTLAARAGFELTGPFPIGPKITLQVQKAPLDQILRTILRQGDCSYGLIYRGDRLTHLILFASTPDKRSVVSPIVPAPAPSPAPSPAPPPVPSPAPSPDLQPGAPPEELLRWTHHPDPQRRLQAFQSLAPLWADGRVHRRLQEGLHDPDPRIRALVQSILDQHTPQVAPNPTPERVPEEQENQE